MAAILSTSFAVAVNDWATQWQLLSVTGVQVGHLCVAESELAQVTGIAGLKVTVRRGVEATAVTTHTAGTPVAIYRSSDLDTDAPVIGAAAVSLRQATVTLTDTQIKALPSTVPVTVVPAAGAMKLLVPVSGVLVGNFTGGGYADISTTALLCVGWPYDNAGGLQNLDGSLTDVTSFLSDTTANIFSQLIFGHAHLVGGVSPVSIPVTSSNPRINKALVVEGFDSVASAWTGGHAVNTLTVTVLYGILDVTTGVWV